MKVMKGTNQASDCIATVARLIGHPKSLPVSEDGSNAILSGIAKSLFEDSDPINSKQTSGTPLGELAENLVCYFTG